MEALICNLFRWNLFLVPYGEPGTRKICYQSTICKNALRDL